ncbi:MAG: hypothetical protein ACUVV0_13640, partial [Anaerolineae bacterium]
STVRFSALELSACEFYSQALQAESSSMLKHAQRYSTVRFSVLELSACEFYSQALQAESLSMLKHAQRYSTVRFSALELSACEFYSQAPGKGSEGVAYAALAYLLSYRLDDKKP